MKNKVIIEVLIIFLIIQIIIPIKVIAFEPNAEIELDEQKTTTGESEKSIFDSSITYSSKWYGSRELDKDVNNGTLVLTPSNADEYESLPAIVWLHGASGAAQDGGNSIKKNSICTFLLKENPELENFSAYIFCPHNPNSKSCSGWTSMGQKVRAYIKNFNVDPDNIVIAGHSMGGNGTIANAKTYKQYFSKAVVFSSSSSTTLLPIPTIWYVGRSEQEAYKKAARDYDKMDPNLKEVCWLDCGHDTIKSGYLKDDGKFVGTANNNRSDVIEWMFEGYMPKLKMSLDNTSLTLPIQQIKQLNVISADGLENETITWTSSNVTVAEVNANGLITALKEGKTTITAKVGTVELTCQVTVSGQLGDVDKDGQITSFDAYKTLKASVDSLIGTEVEEQIQLTSDVNKNGLIESEDAYEILKYSVGVINKF